MKDKLNTAISMFTRFTTVIFFLDSIILLAFKGKSARLLAVDILAILALSLICSIFYLILLYDKEYSKKKMFFMQIVYFAIINTLVLITGDLMCWISFHHIWTVLALEIVILLSIIVTIVYSYKVDSSTAHVLNKKLKELNQD